MEVKKDGNSCYLLEFSNDGILIEKSIRWKHMKKMSQPMNELKWVNHFKRNKLLVFFDRKMQYLRMKHTQAFLVRCDEQPTTFMSIQVIKRSQLENTWETMHPQIAMVSSWKTGRPALRYNFHDSFPGWLHSSRKIQVWRLRISMGFLLARNFPNFWANYLWLYTTTMRITGGPVFSSHLAPRFWRKGFILTEKKDL